MYAVADIKTKASRFWLESIAYVVFGSLAIIYMTNNAQVLMASAMQGHNPPFIIAVTLIILHFDLAAFLGAVLMGWIVQQRLLHISLITGLSLLAYHGYWTHYHLNGAWQWWYVTRVLLLPVFIVAGVFTGHSLTTWFPRQKGSLRLIAMILLAVCAGFYLIHLLSVL